MYDDHNSDPNLDREDVPFPTQNGPPRFQQPAQQPYNGNGHGQPQANQAGISYAQPPFLQSQPQPQVAARSPVREVYPVAQSQLSTRLANVNAGVHAGSTQLAELWANQLQMFRAEFHRLTGREISDREAFDIVTTPLVMAMD